jgi:hypothetical protein
VIGVALTIAVYGVVALIVKMDDIGLHLAQRSNAGTRALGRGLVKAMPVTMEALTVIGTAAMLWVGGGHHRPWPGAFPPDPRAALGRGRVALGRRGSGDRTGDGLAGHGGGLGGGGADRRRRDRRRASPDPTQKGGALRRRLSAAFEIDQAARGAVR